MSFNIGVGSTLIASYTDDGIPYLWKSGDITTTPFNETKIIASDASANDNFGFSVAVGSGRIVVGAPYDDPNGISDAGSAYIFDLNGNQLAKITASDVSANDNFGFSVAVGSGRIVVGAYLEDPNGISNAGSAYIFDLDGNQLAKITASDLAVSDNFGFSVAVGCGRIVIGSFLEDPNGISDAGSAYIFDLNGNQLAKITASDRASGDVFGKSVAVGSGRIVVGAYLESANGISNAGSAYIFDLDGNQLAKITASDGAVSDLFGSSVAVGSGRIIVSSPYASVDGNSSAGAAYIFDLDGNQLSKITASDVGATDYFGWSVAVGCGRIVVGAYLEDPNEITNAGSAYIFDLDGNQLAKITAPDVGAADVFGSSVAVGSGRIIVGAYGEDPNGISDAGAAYIYQTPQIYTLYDAIDLQTI